MNLGAPGPQFYHYFRDPSVKLGTPYRMCYDKIRARSARQNFGSSYFSSHEALLIALQLQTGNYHYFALLLCKEPQVWKTLTIFCNISSS